MVTNVSYALLDAPVIAGRGDDPVVGTMSHARLLEEGAALGGVLYHLGVGPGVPVGDLPLTPTALGAWPLERRCWPAGAP